MNETAKKDWLQPQVTVLGDVETLTLQPKNKTLGGNDGFLFQNQAISG